MKTQATALALLCACSALAADAPPLSPRALGHIDAHAHFLAEAKPVLDLLDRLNLTAVNVCVVDRDEKGCEAAAPQHAMARHLARLARGRLPWVAALDDGGFAAPGFADRALVAEPIAAWEPLDPKSPDYDYYENAPACRAPMGTGHRGRSELGKVRRLPCARSTPVASS